MKAIPRILILLLLVALHIAGARAQGGTSNKGTEFWTCWMNHRDGTGSAMTLYLTGDVNATVVVSGADNTFSKTYTVTPNQVTIVQPQDIPASFYLGGSGPPVNKGIHITSDKNIVVYAHIYANARSGATLVLPVNAMGKDYYSINYTQNPTTYNSAFCVIGTESGATTVEITPTAKLTTGEVANTKFTITLQKGEVYQGLSSTDLTGTHIQSVSTPTEPCKKIAVYSGSAFVSIGCAGKTTADNLFQQAYPTASWGKNYVTAPLSGRNYDVFRIACSDPTAHVLINGAPPTTPLVNNFYYEFGSNTPNIITSDKPIQIAQYAVTQGSNMNCTTNTETVGDPEMIFLSPIEQGLDHVTLYATNKEAITKNFINVILPSSAAPSFILDGASYTNFTPITKTINNTSYSYAQIPFGSAAGTHTISASAPFNAIAYGFGNVESYGYSAGTDIKDLNKYIAFENPQTNTDAATGCVGVNYIPQINIPYTTTSIQWDLKDGTAPFTDANPLPINSVVKDGVTVYTYQSSKTAVYTAAGDYDVVATVFNQNADECGSNDVVDLNYTISNIPTAKFTSDKTTACLGDVINFTDNTQANGVNIKSWAWDFGDVANATATNPNTAATQNAKHTYIKAGDYTITLTVTNDNGCSTSAQQIIHINAIPLADFTATTPDCETQAVTFNDHSSPGEGALTTWLWDFGDGSTPVTNTTNAPVTHTFATANTYNVSLTVTSSTGCVSDIKTIPVVVHPLPVVDFTLPDVCLNDASAQFTDKSTIADNSEGQFTWSWNFGDPNATVANNVSPAKNPTHKYTQVRDASNPYIVTLTVKSVNGCSVTKSQPFVVNGDTPVAAFSVENTNNLCSSEDVIFDDQSSVNFGNVTKLVWYYDFTNHPTDATVYTKDQFPADKKYHHNYGLFYTPAAQNYAVKLEAYSGGTCVNTSRVQTIIVKANPSVALSQIGTICQESQPVQIIENKNGFTGTGTFSGTGITSTGLFDPAVSGPGTFTINYTFVASNGCDYSTSQDVVVNPTPKADAGEDLHLLQGGGITLAATASGVEPLKYKWTMADGSAATALNHDDVLNPVASPSDDVTYMLTVTSADGCTASDNVDVFVLKAPEVPNTFTPNNDGINDKWEIKYLETYPNCTIDVYNRYGEKLYSSIGYPTPWDGSFKGAPLPVGTYYYIINPKNGRKIITGSVTIIR